MFAKLLILLVAAAFVVGMVARTSHGAGPERTYVVKPTDTLWTIALHNYAGDVRQGVWTIEQRNHLTSATLVPGQRIVLPS
ncbi:MAG: LysM peptidoglycan-binding domain-containing protein [Actinobacteria bacterium]|nr:LysM peptidoglycan-binding domain-containing protein [Actinomycetota bacterium]MBV8563544.1 LysM peptidoglycan-binding domain-containing protein [Actinomycetota bacterium]